MTKRTAVSIFTFFVLAFGLTYGFSSLPSIPVATVDLRDILCGFGPLLSGLICYRIFKTPTTYSATGAQPMKTWLIVLASASTFILTNTKDGFTYNVLFAVSQIVYCFGEEFGWRHFLQSATNQINKWLQPFVIALVWFGWHFSWLHDPLKAMTGQNMNAPVPVVILFAFLALALLAYLLGLIMKKTHAVLLPTLVHFAVKTNLPTISVTLGLVVIAVITWNKLRLDKQGGVAAG
jgi:membrane protease YdiL (CAAX protease family)